MFTAKVIRAKWEYTRDKGWVTPLWLLFIPFWQYSLLGGGGTGGTGGVMRS